MCLLKCKPPGEKAALVSTCVNCSIKRPVFSFCVRSLPNLHPSFGSLISHMVSTQWMSWGPSDLLSLQSVRPRFDRPYLCCKNELGSRPVPPRAVHGLLREQTSEAGLRQSLQHSWPWRMTTPSSTASQPGWKDATERKLNILSLFRAVYT